MNIHRQENEMTTKEELENDIQLKEKLGLGLGQTIQNWIQDFLKILAERLDKMEEVLVVDRIEGDIAVCENRKNGKMQEMNLKDLPEDIEEGTILKWREGKYEIDNSKEIEQRIEQKMKDVWK